MAAVTGTVRVSTPHLGATTLVVTAPNTTDDGDTIAITLADHGITTFLGHLGYIHTTEDSVIVQEQATTAVSSGVLTLTVGGSTDDKKRTYIVWGI